MKTKTIWMAVGGAVAMVALWLLVAAAPDPTQFHVPGALTLGGKTNVYTDDGSALFRNGVVVGGGGDTLWTNGILGAVTLVTPTNVVNVPGLGGGYQVGSFGSISNNWTGGADFQGDAFLAEANASIDGYSNPWFLDMSTYIDAGTYGFFNASVQTNAATMTMKSLVSGQQGESRFQVDVSGDNPGGNGMSFTVTGTNILQLFPSGKLTLAGVVDPPSVLYDPNTRLNAARQAKEQLTKDKGGGMLLFFNKETTNLEVLIPNTGQFYSISMTPVEKIEPLSLVVKTSVETKPQRQGSSRKPKR